MICSGVANLGGRGDRKTFSARLRTSFIVPTTCVLSNGSAAMLLFEAPLDKTEEGLKEAFIYREKGENTKQHVIIANTAILCHRTN